MEIRRVREAESTRQSRSFRADLPGLSLGIYVRWWNLSDMRAYIFRWHRFEIWKLIKMWNDSIRRSCTKQFQLNRTQVPVCTRAYLHVFSYIDPVLYLLLNKMYLGWRNKRPRWSQQKHMAFRSLRAQRPVSWTRGGARLRKGLPAKGRNARQNGAMCTTWGRKESCGRMA